MRDDASERTNDGAKNVGAHISHGRKYLESLHYYCSYNLAVFSKLLLQPRTNKFSVSIAIQSEIMSEASYSIEVRRRYLLLWTMLVGAIMD
jgi:hypothetical protein